MTYFQPLSSSIHPPVRDHPSLRGISIDESGKHCLKRRYSVAAGIVEYCRLWAYPVKSYPRRGCSSRLPDGTKYGTRSPQGQPDLDVTGGLADGEPNPLETLHRASVPRRRIVKLETEAVERCDDAAAANDVEVRGHVARDAGAPAQAWHGALCRFHRFRLGHRFTPHNPRGCVALRAERRRDRWRRVIVPR